MEKNIIEIDKNYIQKIQKESDFVRYIKLLSSLKDVVVVIAVKDTIGYSVQSDGYEALCLMGLSKFDSQNIMSNHWKGYVAVLENGEVQFEKIGKLQEPVLFKGRVNGVDLDVVSAPFHRGNIASILINREEYSTNRRGVNIVLISPKMGVIDSVAFDTHVIERTCVRRYEYTRGMGVIPSDDENFFNRKLEEVIKRLDVNYITNGWHEPNDGIIKVRIFFFGWYALWNAIESFVEALEEDSRFEILIIMESDHKKTWDVISQGYRSLIFKDEYDIENDRPDIIVYNSDIFVPKVKQSAILSVYIGAGLNDGGEMNFGTDDWIESVEKKLDADLYFVEKHLAKKDKWYGVGNPKFDIIYRNINRELIKPKIWNKLKGKTVILWAPDHKWVQKDLTFDLYARPFLDYFQANTDMGLIIRMHPSYPSELIEVGVWTEEDFRRLIKYVSSFPNIVWDDRKDYGLAYSMSDAVVTDINCGITISSLPLDVPVAVTMRYDGEMCRPNCPDVIEALYQIHSVDEAYKFFCDVKNRKDPLKYKRKMLMNRYVANFDGKNGERIKKIIEEKYFSRLNRE